MERDKRFEVRLTAEEYDTLSRAAATGKFKNISDLMRTRALDPECSERNLRLELRTLTFQIRKIGVNINQIAHWLNAGYGMVSEADTILKKMDEIDKHLEDIKQLIKRDG